MRRFVPIAVLLAAVEGQSDEPLHVRIDSVISSQDGFAPARPASDAAFLRRVYLDFAGIIPPPETVRSFLADVSPDNRTAIIDELLARPEYAWHMSRVFDVMLDQRMREREDDVIKAPAWRAYLLESFRQNKSWSRMVAEMLGTDGTDAELRGALRFYFSRKGDIGQLIPDVSAILLGRNLRCAQCHDHPLIDEYKQADFFGLAAFYSRVERDTVGGHPVLVERPVGVTTFTSTLTSESGTSLPRVFDGPVQEEPAAVKALQMAFERSIETAKQASDNAKAAKDALAAAQKKQEEANQAVTEATGTKDSAAATLAAARKAVDEAKDNDDEEALAEASEAEKAALDGLAAAINQLNAAREKASEATKLTQQAEASAKRAGDAAQAAEAKQRAAEANLYVIRPADNVRPIPIFSRRAYLAPMVLDHPAFRRNIANRLWAMMMGRGLIEPLDLDYSGNRASHPELLTLLADEFAAMDYDINAFLRELALTDTYGRSSRTDDVSDAETAPYSRAAVRKLSPEQLAWSWLRATGRLDVELTKLREEQKDTELALADAQLKQLHARLAEDVKQVTAPFVTSIPGEAERNEAVPEQALFLLNAETIAEWLEPQPGNLLDRLLKIDDVGQLANELFVSVLSRRPTDAEATLVREQLAGLSSEQRADSLADLAWSLLSSSEFRFQH